MLDQCSAGHYRVLMTSESEWERLPVEVKVIPSLTNREIQEVIMTAGIYDCIQYIDGALHRERVPAGTCRAQHR